MTDVSLTDPLTHHLDFGPLAGKTVVAVGIREDVNGVYLMCGEVTKSLAIDPFNGDKPLEAVADSILGMHFSYGLSRIEGVDNLMFQEVVEVIAGHHGRDTLTFRTRLGDCTITCRRGVSVSPFWATSAPNPMPTPIQKEWSA